ncbi:Long chronological lifespan protein 2 [Parahypoxylon ruwenzoriense]
MRSLRFPLPIHTLLLLLLLSLTATTNAQFGFFEQMFGGQQQQQQQQRTQQPQNVPSDSSIYRANFDRMHCDNYLCPDTLACVHFPHHCPCPWPSNEDKFETGDGHRICVSKGGFKPGEAARKVKLARKGML